MKDAVRIGIAVVTYKSQSTLLACLRSIRAHAPASYVVVVENGGEIASVRSLAAAVSGLSVEVIDPAGNVGYARGVNLAFREISTTDCTHFLVLNPDVELLMDPARLVPGLRSADVVSGCLVSPGPPPRLGRKGHVQATNVRRATTWWSSVTQSVLGTRSRSIRWIGKGRWVDAPQIDGAYMLQTVEYYRRNPFAEEYELYFEDVEYCDRARAGTGIRVMGEIFGVHASGSSAAKSGGLAYVANRVSRARYLRRRYPRLPALVLRVPFALEFLTRELRKGAEGQDVRRAAYQLAATEAARPGTVHVLTGDGVPETTRRLSHLADDPPGPRSRG